MGKGLQGLATAVLAALAVVFVPAAAMAGEGQPSPWQMNFQVGVTPIADQIHQFHNFLLVIITVITLFVLALLIYVMFRFSEKANPRPSQVTHHTWLEVAWTVIPVLILIVIAIPSFRLLFAQYNFPKADVTIKAIGNQWYWSYEYPDQDNMSFDSVMLEENELKPGQPRLLSVDNEVVVPVNKNIHVLVTASDVIHNWTVPSLGVKMDAVPGRLLKTWFRAEKPGIYYGQCSELCGSKHAFMPIAVRVVSDEEFASWVAGRKNADLEPVGGETTKVAVRQ
ncbi:MAG: cytochrome c oxidase subunit II [Hyphomicrobiales bacterium]